MPPNDNDRASPETSQPEMCAVLDVPNAGQNSKSTSIRPEDGLRETDAVEAAHHELCTSESTSTDEFMKYIDSQWDNILADPVPVLRSDGDSAAVPPETTVPPDPPEPVPSLKHQPSVVKRWLKRLTRSSSDYNKQDAERRGEGAKMGAEQGAEVVAEVVATMDSQQHSMNIQDQDTATPAEICNIFDTESTIPSDSTTIEPSPAPSTAPVGEYLYEEEPENNASLFADDVTDPDLTDSLYSISVEKLKQWDRPIFQKVVVFQLITRLLDSFQASSRGSTVADLSEFEDKSELGGDDCHDVREAISNELHASEKEEDEVRSRQSTIVASSDLEPVTAEPKSVSKRVSAPVALASWVERKLSIKSKQRAKQRGSAADEGQYMTSKAVDPENEEQEGVLERKAPESGEEGSGEVNADTITKRALRRVRSWPVAATLPPRLWGSKVRETEESPNGPSASEEESAGGVNTDLNGIPITRTISDMADSSMLIPQNVGLERDMSSCGMLWGSRKQHVSTKSFLRRKSSRILIL